MIVVFVIDTSPSMGLPLKQDLAKSSKLKEKVGSLERNNEIRNSGTAMSRLDLAKMTVETLCKCLDKRIQEHNRQFVQLISVDQKNKNNQQQMTTMAQSLQNIGLGYTQSDHFLLLCTGRQQQQQDFENISQLHKHKQIGSKLRTTSNFATTDISCGAGGRLLVGYGSSDNLYGWDNSSNQQNQNNSNSSNTGISKNNQNNNNSSDQHQQYKQMFLHGHAHHGVFEQQLKKLKATQFSHSISNAKTASLPDASAVGGNKPQHQQNEDMPEDGGGALGLNIALSTGFQLLSRHRLRFRSTENFGMGRLPSAAMLSPSNNAKCNNKNTTGFEGENNTTLTNAILPACLILLTDGECLIRPKAEGGGSLQLQFGNMPLRDFYSEPFKWDQRFFCVNIGNVSGSSQSTSGDNIKSNLHPSLKALCDVTGGGHISINSSSSISQTANTLLRLIAPSRPEIMPIPDPLRLPTLPPIAIPPPSTPPQNGTFVNGGPVCAFQTIERRNNGEPGQLYRAIILPYVCQRTEPSPSASDYSTIAVKVVQSSPPIWCIPENFFPNKKLDTLPPRHAHPLLNFTRHFNAHGTNNVDPLSIMKSLHRLDQLTIVNKQIHAFIKQKNMSQQSQFPISIQLLQRDVYICHWIGKDNRYIPHSQRNLEHFPVYVHGAVRPSLSETNQNFLSIGILHVPYSSENPSSQLSTITFLPPEPQILLPLLIRAAEAEHRILKKALDASTIKNNTKNKSRSSAGILQKQQQQLNASSMNMIRNINLDENWRTEFRAYLFRIPIYYQHALRRCLRHILPSSVHSLLGSDGIETIASQCFSRVCLQKIRNGELTAKEANERLDRQEDQMRRKGVPYMDAMINRDGTQQQKEEPGYGQYDPRGSRSAYLGTLKSMPPPWRIHEDKSRSRSVSNLPDQNNLPLTEILGDLPPDLLLSYYESRRRWIFGGVSLCTKGLSVEGVTTEGTDSQKYNKDHTVYDESLLSVSGVGASLLNKTTINKMGDYRERLLWTRSPVVGYEGATTAADGSIIWSVDDDALPWQFFDPITGEFSDSLQNRIRARLTVNFGNPYKDKRGDSLVPEIFQHQRPKFQNGNLEGNRRGGNESPPHDDFDDFSSSIEGEGEAMFAGKHHISQSTKNSNPNEEIEQGITPTPPAKLGTKRKNDESNSVANQKTKKQMREHNSTNDRKDNPRSKNNQLKAPPATPPPPPPPRPPRPPPQPFQGQKTKLNKNSANTANDHVGSAPSKIPKPPPPPQPHDIPKQRKRGSLSNVGSSANKRGVRAPPPPPPKSKPKPPPKAKLSQRNIKSGTTTDALRTSETQEQPKQTQQHQAFKSTNISTLPPPVHKSQTRPSSNTKNINTQPPPPPADNQSPHIKPKVNLPTGWISVWSKSQKRWYFFDTKTNKSVWQWPPTGID